MSKKGFKPSRGKIAIRNIGNDCESETGGIIYTKKENRVFGKAEILSIGHSEITDSGKVVKVDFEVGDYIIYDKTDGYGAYASVLLIRPHQVVAIIDKDTEID